MLRIFGLKILWIFHYSIFSPVDSSRELSRSCAIDTNSYSKLVLDIRKMNHSRNFEVGMQIVYRIFTIFGLNIFDPTYKVTWRTLCCIGLALFGNLNVFYTLFSHRNNFMMTLRCLCAAPEAFQVCYKKSFLSPQIPVNLILTYFTTLHFLSRVSWNYLQLWNMEKWWLQPLILYEASTGRTNKADLVVSKFWKTVLPS